MRDPRQAPEIVGCLPMGTAPACSAPGNPVVHPGKEATMRSLDPIRKPRNKFYRPSKGEIRCRWCGILCSSVGSVRDHEFFCPKKPKREGTPNE